VSPIDVVNLLPKVVAPTLVLHSRHDNSVLLDEGRRIAASIPNAKFVSLATENHVPVAEEPAWQTFVSEIESFLLESCPCLLGSKCESLAVSKTSPQCLSKRKSPGLSYTSHVGHKRTNQAGGDKSLQCTTTAQFSLLESWPSIR
jgi:hypothetical protein